MGEELEVDGCREAYGLPDCTQPVPLEELPDKPETIESAAMRVFGKPFNELARRDQRLITRVHRGHRMELQNELRYALKVAAKENALSAHEVLAKMDDIDERSHNIMQMLADDCEALFKGDDMDVTASGSTTYMKTKAGTARRNLRHAKTFMQVKKLHVDTLIAKAKLVDEKLTVVQNNDNRTQEALVVTPEAVKERLGRFGVVPAEKTGGDCGDVGSGDD